MSEPDGAREEGDMPEKRLILILGGARSGKSAYAERLAGEMARGGPVVYVATATADDDEMRQRITRHRAVRSAEWLTLEAPLDPAHALLDDARAASAGVVLLDCVTLLVSNLLLDSAGHEIGEARFDAAEAEARVQRAIADLLAAFRQLPASLILVSNEVGMGLVPPYPLGRVYRDLLGRANMRLAREADIVLFMLAGLPVELKALARAWEESAARQLGFDAGE
ncbi:MAG TPA: bifunctional adenosylcobinamide kinase/adenosylcobinamide-phosphate guanylyltransferase [Ktedonobacterales bacterium]